MTNKVSFKLTILLLLSVASTGTFTSCHSGDSSRTTPGNATAGGSATTIGPTPYKVTAVYSGPATTLYSFPATIQGQQNVEIRPKVDGFIQRIFVDEGATVRKGQPLFQLRNPQYEAAVRSASSAVKIAEADVLTAEMNVEEVKPLVEKNILSPYELKSKEYALQSKKASLASANADLVNAQVNVSYTFLTSPSDGVIGSIPYKTGSLVSSTSANPLTTVYNTKNVYAYFSLNEKQVLSFLRAVKGNSIQDKLATMPDATLILADGSEYPARGRVLTASGLISTETGSASFRATFPNMLGLIRSGSSATIKLPVHLDTAILIPQIATYDLQGKKFVYAITDKDSTVSTAIQVSGNPIGNFYLVESGLKKGDNIVLEGVGNLREGTRVKPVPVNMDSLYVGATSHGIERKK